MATQETYNKVSFKDCDVAYILLMAAQGVSTLMECVYAECF